MTTKPNITEGWEKRFDEQFRDGVPSMTIHNNGTEESWIEHKEIKSFIRTLLEAQREEIVEMGEGLKQYGCEELKRTGMCGHFHGSDSSYNAAISAYQSKIRGVWLQS